MGFSISISQTISIGFFIFLSIVVFTRVYVFLSLPESKSGTVSVSRVSGERAYNFLRDHIAKEPHPWDTEENEKVFEFILGQGRLLEERYGTDVIEVDTQITKERWRDLDTYGLVRNVAFLIKGERTGEESSAIQISSHYDSAWMSPGATDAGAACAVMLELASVLASREQKLRYDVLILFVDAEEVGLDGSYNWLNGDSDIEMHPWSLLPSLVINLEGSGIANGKEMLIRANTQEASTMYISHAKSPRALSLSEFLFRVIDVGYTDTDNYVGAGLHCMDLIYVKDRWAYHSVDDTVENVKPEALQHLGDNLLSLVEGTNKDVRFPMKRVSIDEAQDMAYNQDSSSVYFSILDNGAVHQTRSQARALYISISIIAGISMYFLYPTNGNFPNGKFRTITKHTLLAFVNFIAGMLFSFVVFGAVGSWKKPEGVDDVKHSHLFFVWEGKEAARSVLTFISVACSTFCIYAIHRGGWLSNLCCCKCIPSYDEKAMDSEENETNAEHQDVEESEEENTSLEASKIAGSLPESAIECQGPDSSVCTDTVQLGRNAHIGIFFFFDFLLLIFGITLPDGGPLLFFQVIFFWIGSFTEAISDRFLWNGEATGEEPSIKRALRTWALRSFVSVIPSLFVIPDGFMLLILYFGFFLDELGFWYGATLVEAFNFGLVILLIVPTALLLPTKYARILGFVLLGALLLSMIVCMAI